MKKHLLAGIVLCVPLLSGCAAYVYPSHGGHYRRVFHDDVHIDVVPSRHHHHSPPLPPRPRRPWRP
jgi:hypothetical protein